MSSASPPAVEQPPGPSRYARQRWVPYLLLMVAFALGLTQARRASITFDEGPHLAVGYTTLRTGDLRLQPVHIHPPLANVLAAFPLLVHDDLPDPRQIDGWGIASLSAVTDAVVWQQTNPRRIALAGRVPILLLNTLLGAVVVRWARDLAGLGAGVLALTFHALDPNLIAHSALITTDIAATLNVVATLFLVHRYVRRPRSDRRRWGHLLAIGVLLGLGQLTKVSALMLIPVLGLLLLADAWHRASPMDWRPTRRRPIWPLLREAAVALAVVLGVAALVVWAGYGFELSPVAGLPFPVPAATHVDIFRSLREHYDLGHPTFALGRVSTDGWWWYFPLAFAVKTPLPVLILTLGVAVWKVVRWIRGQRPRRSSPIETLTLALFPLLYVAASLFSSVNIGYRHLLPVLPFLYVGLGIELKALLPSALAPSIAGDLGARIQRVRKESFALYTLVLLLAWLLGGTLRVLPYPLTFFNELAGGPANGYRYLVDSNLDWGQNLWDLRAWMDAHGEDRVRYAHYSPARPEVYGIDATMLPPSPRAEPPAPWWPAPGLYAIGATVLQGPYAPEVNTYAWFRSHQPIARLGNALFLYRVPPRPAPEWLALCGPQDGSYTTAQLGLPDLRVIDLDCAQSRLYPEGGPGLYLGSTDPVSGAEPVLTLRDAQGRTTAALRQVEPPYLPSSLVPAQAEIDGPLTFLGHTLETAEDRVILETYWRVDTVPDRPLSLMAHLIGPDGAAVTVADGLGVPREQWRPGDLIVQRHDLTPAEAVSTGDYTLLTGAYWLDTMERWSVTGPQPRTDEAIHVDTLHLP